MEIGNTPLVRLRGFEKAFHLNSKIYAKLEFLNTFGSIKDRSAKFMIEDAESKGLITKKGMIVEASSGNLGVSLAGIATSKGYSCRIYMPNSEKNKKVDLIRSYGAEVIETPPELGLKFAKSCADEYAKSIQNCFMPNQFESQSNVNAHALTTAPEIDRELKGQVDYIIAGIGSGGTAMGIAQYFINRSTKIIGVEPEYSPILREGWSGTHRIYGIGAGFIPHIVKKELLSEIVGVRDEDAYFMQEKLIETDSIHAGYSSGAVLYAAKILAERRKKTSNNIVIIFADSIERYK